MAFIPADARWYLADIVEQITVEGDKRSIIHTNMMLVRADSPEEAYEKAILLGRGVEQSYQNIEGKKVKCRFRGLHDLNVIHEELEHGAEIGYSAEIGMKEKSIKAWVTPKRKLGVFAPRIPSIGPDYAAGDIIRKLYKAMKLKEEKE